MFKMSLKIRNKELTHWISMSFARLSSLSKSSLFITLPPELVLQPFVFQLSTQLVIPVQREYHHESAIKEASKDQNGADSLLTRHCLCTKSQAKTLETKYNSCLVLCCCLSWLHFFIISWITQQIFNLKTTILYMHTNYLMNFNKPKQVYQIKLDDTASKSTDHQGIFYITP